MKSHARPPLYQPDGGLAAWLQVVGSFLINMNNWGLANSFGVYQAYYQFELLQSHRALLLLIGAFSGPLFDKEYFRLIQIFVGLGVVFARMMLSLTRDYYSVMLSQGVLLGVCLGFLYILSVALIPLYFKKNRGLALGLATAGGSLGGVLYPLIFRQLLNHVGFAWTNRVMDFLALTTMLLSVALVIPIGAMTELPYFCFMIAGLLLFAGVLVPFFLVTIYAEQALSASANLSFYLLMVLNGSQLFGRVLGGLLSDHIGGEIMLLGAIITTGILSFCWNAIRDLAGYIVWLVVYGFISGMVVTLPAVVLPYLCPSMAVLGTRLGMVYAAGGIGFLISSPVALAINDVSGAFFDSVAAKEAWTRRRLYKSS
ncbi:MFS general substrate transporter [Aureobasidium namibiae CBS 147.97]|uniref:MFS general substrate transporter n=1 Tax=Aureobasidium namibiae CBS 147.97 TaxID=1043004 RepID=A0A074W6Q7_9PEZI|nr:MFS general substrate transporter [Aureobasidium namibiae CBS 147.97]KEQ68568.1 MFS general substrate transporter [Aureobasidium namibiae CBS 147.97]